MIKKYLFCLAMASTALSMTACSSLEPRVEFPPQTGLDKKSDVLGRETTDWEKEKARQASLYQAAMDGRDGGYSGGSIYASANFRSIYEDVKAKYVGDMVNIQIVENINAQQSKRTTAQRSDSVSIDVPAIGGSKGFKGISGSASGDKDFDGEGGTSASNLMRGSIVATVIEVLPNGYLRVAGEKQIGTNQQVEWVRFYGVVNPFTIRPGNRVVSTEVADARIEYRGKGTVDSTQMMGWLSRVFLTVMPF